MPAPRHDLRFVIQTDSGARSSEWHIFALGDDIYVQSLYAGGKLKTSLHKSGLFRHAFTEQEAPKWVGSGDRAFMKWSRPALEPGYLRLPLEIRIPTNELTVPEHEPSPEAKCKFRFIEPAPASAETVVSLFQLPPGGDEIRGTGRATLNGAPFGDLIENWKLATAGQLLINVRHQPLDAAFTEGIAAARRDLARQVGERPPEEGHTRLVLFTHDHETEIANYVDLAPA